MAGGEFAAGTLQPDVSREGHFSDHLDVGGDRAGILPGLEVPEIGGDTADLDAMSDLHIDPGYDLENLAGQGSVDGRTDGVFDDLGGGSEAADSLDGATGEGYGPMQTIKTFDTVMNVGGLGIGVATVEGGPLAAAAVGAFAGGWSVGREIGNSEVAYEVVAAIATPDPGAFGEGAAAPAGPGAQTNAPDENSPLLGGNDHGTTQPADSSPAPRNDGQSREGADADAETSVGQPAASGGTDASRPTEDQLDGGYSGPRSPGSALTDDIGRSILQGLGGDRGGEIDPGSEPGESYDASAGVYDLEDAVVNPGADFVAGGAVFDTSILDDPIAAASPYFREADI